MAWVADVVLVLVVAQEGAGGAWEARLSALAVNASVLPAEKEYRTSVAYRATRPNAPSVGN